MKILCIGDIVGENGVKKFKEELPKIREEEKIDFVIVNAENSAGGMGITTKIFNDILNINVDAITMGNHTWGKKDIFSFIDHPKLLRPANYSKGVVGHGYGIYNCNDKKIGVIDLIGRTDMNVLSDNPFTRANEIIDKIKKDCDMIFVEFHAEATAEKIAMAKFLDGRATAVYGTHTHVQTADETILENGTAYITDIGMTGPMDSVIGMDCKASIKRFVTSLPERYKLAEGNCMLNGCIFEVNDENCRVININRIVNINENNEETNHFIAEDIYKFSLNLIEKYKSTISVKSISQFNEYEEEELKKYLFNVLNELYSLNSEDDMDDFSEDSDDTDYFNGTDSDKNILNELVKPENIKAK